jgi:hypothetical protein
LLPCRDADADGVMRLGRPTILLLCLTALGCATAAPVWSSTIIDRNTTTAALQVSSAGQALVSYRANGKSIRVLAWGAKNASMPSQTTSQVVFKLDYSGGYKSGYLDNPAVKDALAGLRALKAKMAQATAAHDNPLRYSLAPKIAAAYSGLARLRAAATSFRSSCRPYSGPALPWLVAACTASDGSFWALQSWQRALPDLGETPWLAAQSVWELHLSHWSGPLPVLEIHLDWVNTQKAQHLFGRLSYLGVPVHGYGSEANGNPTDTYGRNIYLDVLNAPGYGPGWKRENSFLTHNPGGNFCYGLYPHAPYPGYPAGERPAGIGERYRATVIGPGVLPDIGWDGASIGALDPADAEQVSYEQQMNALSDTFSTTDKLCHQH